MKFKRRIKPLVTESTQSIWTLHMRARSLFCLRILGRLRGPHGQLDQLLSGGGQVVYLRPSLCRPYGHCDFYGRGIRETFFSTPRGVARTGRFRPGKKFNLLRASLFENLYRHYRVVRMAEKAKRVIRDLFSAYVANPGQLPPHVSTRLDDDGLERVVCDYIAGMTDRFALDEHKRLFDPHVRL